MPRGCFWSIAKLPQSVSNCFGAHRLGTPPPVGRCRGLDSTPGGLVHTPASSKHKKGPAWGPLSYLAEGVGFEPTVRKTVHLISSQARSTTPAPLRPVLMGM